MNRVVLPPAAVTGGLPLHQALMARYSCRDFDRSKSIDLAVVSQLLWSCQGLSHRSVRHPSQQRCTSPSAGATYPLDVFLVSGPVDGLPSAIYMYDRMRHELQLIREGDHRSAVADAALHQSWVADASICVVIGATYSRCNRKYGERGFRYSSIEVGLLCQNLALVGTSCGLGSCVVGAFEDKTISQLVNMGDSSPLAVVPVGVPLA